MAGRTRRRQRAQALPLAAIATVAMVGGLAMVVDTGMFLVIQRQLQTAADAAALAGALFPSVCPGTAGGCSSSATAVQVATSIAQLNAGPLAALCEGGVAPPDVQVGTVLNSPKDVNTIVVTLSCDATYSFGRILPVGSTKHIQVSAAAAVGNYGLNGELANLDRCPARPPSGTFPPCRFARLID